TGLARTVDIEQRAPDVVVADLHRAGPLVRHVAVGARGGLVREVRVPLRVHKRVPATPSATSTRSAAAVITFVGRILKKLPPEGGSLRARATDSRTRAACERSFLHRRDPWSRSFNVLCRLEAAVSAHPRHADHPE